MKESKKQIKARLTNELKKKYDKRLSEATEKIDEWKKRYFEANDKLSKKCKECKNLEAENEELKQKLDEYKDWIERMQEFCNMPDGEREQAFIEYVESVKAKKEANKNFTAISSLFKPWFAGLSLTNE